MFMCFINVKSIENNMTSSLKENEESLAVETYCSELDKVLLLITEIRFEAKKLLK